MMALCHSSALSFINITTKSFNRKTVSLMSNDYCSYKISISFILGHTKDTWEQLETEPFTESFQYCLDEVSHKHPEISNSV